jgi:hypothetical protein
MIRYFFMSDFQVIGIFRRTFFQKEGRETPVEAFPQNLFNQPYDVVEPGRDDPVGVVGKRGGFFHHLFISGGRDHEKIGILFRFYGNSKLDAGENAGGGKETDIALEQPVDRDLPSLIRGNESAQPAGNDAEQPLALIGAVVDQTVFFSTCRGMDSFSQKASVSRGQFLPDRQEIR